MTSKVDMLGLPLDSNDWPKEYEVLAVFSYSYVTKECFLHSVDSTEKMAEAHKKMVLDEYRLKEERCKVWVERICMNHAFAGGFRV